LIACLTIAGVPFLSGFFSKDEILVAAWQSNKFLFAVEFLVAGITAFYMFRLYFNIFWGKEKTYAHPPHESPLTMTIPLVLLALGSIFAGYLPFSELISSDYKPFETTLHLSVAIPSVLIGLAGIGLAMLLYRRESTLPDRIAASLGSFYKVVLNKFYIDELYLFVTRKIIFNYISRPIAWFDRHIVDGTMNGIGWVTETSSQKIKGLQSGRISQYGFVFAIAAVGLALVFIYFIN